MKHSHFCSWKTLSLNGVNIKWFEHHYWLLLRHPFNSLFSRTTWINRYQKGKTILHLNETRDDGVLGCSGISWTICKQSAPRSRQITTTTPHRSIFTDHVLFLMHNQQWRHMHHYCLCMLFLDSFLSVYHANVRIQSHCCISHYYSGFLWHIYPLKSAPFHRGILTPSNTWFPGLTKVHNPQKHRDTQTTLHT